MKFWRRPDLLPSLSPNVDLVEVQRLRIEADRQLKIEKFQPMMAALEALPLASEIGPICSQLDRDAVTLESQSQLPPDFSHRLEAAIEQLAPWRKGPFELFGRVIDSEWRSQLKWNRIVDALGDLRSRRVLDVGCGNGYYMFRAASQNPAAVVGLDPSVPFFIAFELVQRYLQNPAIQYERLGCQHLHVFDQAFDIVMCMGVLYHQRSPIEVLRSLRNCLRVGGIAIIESQTIPGNESVCLFPEDRYAKARNVFFVPTKECLVNWVRRSGFKNVEVVSHTRVTEEEQRPTRDMTWESLPDFLDTKDKTKTIEGYPAPFRTVVRAERKFL